jgi:hypothetical protein
VVVGRRLLARRDRHHREPGPAGQRVDLRRLRPGVVIAAR